MLRLLPALGPLRLLFAGVLIVAGVTSADLLNRLPITAPHSFPRIARARAEAPPPLPQPQANVVRSLSSNEALTLNEGIPFSVAPLEPARPFVATSESTGALGMKAALDCLTAAVYYEAAGQGIEGERAIAQVVLNRVRHPAFPSSICGVVYQGSDRATGCQFTFTCDGSLARKPTEAGWSAARRIAAEALAGYVDRSVGMATHYHADFVVPYWAGDLTKIAAVGDHIFYRWSGYWGKRAVFRQLYTGETPPTSEAVADSSADAHATELPSGPAVPSPVLAADLASSRLPEMPAAAVGAKVELRADENSGALKIDEDHRQEHELAGVRGVSALSSRDIQELPNDIVSPQRRPESPAKSSN
jgi:hypothetical protein